MPFDVWSLWRRATWRRATLGLTVLLALGAASASATPFLVADVDSGQVLIANDATEVWYPASLTKLMTVYVALDAVRNRKLTMDTPLVMSARAARMAPSKMGFRPGTEVTLDNALKMLMVKSPNDVAVMIAEGISGSVEAFADDMNAAGQRLGLHESHFVNPNGLHDPSHVSSARDMAIIARALLRDFPEHADLYGIGELQLGREIIRNHNGLLGRYPGVDGMKTGFTCPAGFNVVASANHNGRRLIVVVLGSPTARLRNEEAADLFDRGFAMGAGSDSLESLPTSASTVAADTRSNVCIHRNAVALAAAEEESLAESEQNGSAGRGNVVSGSVASLSPAHTELSEARPHFDPVPVFVGPVPGWTGPVLAARPGSAIPNDAKAYSSVNTDAPDARAAGQSAPAILRSSVRTPSTERISTKRIRRAAAPRKGKEKAPAHATSLKGVRTANEKIAKDKTAPKAAADVSNH